MVGFESQIDEFTNRRSGRWRRVLLRLSLTFELSVIAFAVGIALYFAWPTEPNLVGVLGVLVGTIILIRQSPKGLTLPLTGVLLIVSGVSWASIQTKLASPNPVAFEQRLEIEGWVSSIDQSGPMRRLYIDVVTTDPVPRNGQPHRVRIRVGRKFEAFSVGEGIRVSAVVGPVPGPAIPNGYDPGRRAFFDGLAGTGFAISHGQKIDPDLSLLSRLKAGIERSRCTIATRVLQNAPEATSGLQAALLTGIRDYIPDEQTDSLRRSGLAHILAISGLHMGMVAFGVYVVASISLASIGRISRARDVRKWAAAIGILSATAYLGLSGASVATQRAYIMVCIAFMAVILDRRVISLRSVAVAALATLLIRPEALLSVGFQMSFAAVASMVVIFRAWQDRWPKQKAAGLQDRIREFYGSLFGTSLIAGFATGGFALLHFGRLANYGLIANMAAMTVFPLVMALGIISLLLMPFALDEWTLAIMGRLIEFMLGVSNWVSDLPGAVANIKASQPSVIALYGLGFALACTVKGRFVFFGASLMLASVLLWIRSPVYDVRITDDGRLSLISSGQAATTSLRADRYGRKQFARASGLAELDWTNYRDDFAECDSLGCRFTLNNLIVSVIEAPSEVPQACSDSNIVMLAKRDAGPVARRGCTATLLDRRVLLQSGGYHIRSKKPVLVTPIMSSRRRNRPWGQDQLER